VHLNVREIQVIVSGCSVSQDPDCGCANDNSCCGIGCNSGSDNDCSSVIYFNPAEYYIYLPDSGVDYLAFEQTFELNAPISWNDFIVSADLQTYHVSGEYLKFTIDDYPSGYSQGIKRKFYKFYSDPGDNIWYSISTPLSGFQCGPGSTICDGLQNPIPAGVHTLKVWHTRGNYNSGGYWVRFKNFKIDRA